MKFICSYFLEWYIFVILFFFYLLLQVPVGSALAMVSQVWLFRYQMILIFIDSLNEYYFSYFHLNR
jgi:hypothetical protein